jgi:VIT1/CCC1 family predicted Fe2+/Mn2+ transporter
MKDSTDPSIQVTLTTFPDGMRKTEVRGLSIEHAKEMVTKAMEDPNQRNEHLYKIIAITIGTTFLVALLALTVFLPEPTKFQQRVLLSILALAAAGFAVALTGVLNVTATTGKRLRIAATGAAAVFVIMLFVDPS